MSKNNGEPDRMVGAVLTPIERGVLEACREVTLRQQEMLPLLGKALQVPENKVFYSWALRRCPQHGRLEGTDWVYFFHGLECDLRNTSDRRFLRIDFGPGGRVDTFTMWGVLQFIMTSLPPWGDYPEPKQHFAKEGPPFDEFSGSFEKMVPVWESLETRGAFERASPDLTAFEASHTSVGPDGLKHVRFPPGTSEELAIDCSVAHRQRLSPVGHSLLEALVAAHPA